MLKRFLVWLGLEFISEEKKCKNCESLRDVIDYERLKNIELLEFERSRNREMLKALTELINPPKPEPIDTSNLKPVLSRHIPFSARKAQLERESVARAEQIRSNSPLAAQSSSVKELKMPITQMSEIEKLEADLDISSEA